MTRHLDTTRSPDCGCPGNGIVLLSHHLHECPKRTEVIERLHLTPDNAVIPGPLHLHNRRKMQRGALRSGLHTTPSTDTRPLFTDGQVRLLETPHNGPTY